VVAYRHNELGSILTDLGNLAGVRTHHERAIKITEATVGSDHPDLATRHSNLGLVLADLGDLAGARTQLELALEIGQATLAQTTQTTPTWPSSAAISTMSAAAWA
jgi:hypothetical protein